MVRRGYVLINMIIQLRRPPTHHEQLTLFPLKIATGSNAGEITLKDALDRLATDLPEATL